jgi:diadenylate cyclase
MMLLAAFPWEALARLDWRAALDILLIAAAIYYLLTLLRGTSATQIAGTIVLLLLCYRAARWARLEMTEWLLATALAYFAIALLILFQPEIRRGLARAGLSPLWKRFFAQNPAGAYDDVLLAVRYFAQSRIGALIVIERETGLRTYLESGVPLDATLSYDLLLAIFRPESPLHDGAIIISGHRVAAAACFLPLALSPGLSSQLGTRHRAAIGITEESDALVIVVSEQTGAIALAHEGTLEGNLSPEQLAERLTELVKGYRAPMAAVGATAGKS